MPIISKRIEYRRTQRDGRIRVREEHTDTWGNLHNTQPYLVSSDAEADSILAARDLGPSLTRGYLFNVIAWVRARNDTSTFDYSETDITEDDGEEAVFSHFATSPGEEAIKFAWWMDSINTGQFNAIRDRIGYTGEQGADITSRFTFMVSVEPWYNFTVEV